MKGRRTLVVHPYLVAGYSVVALAAENIEERIPLMGALATLIAACCGTAIAWFLSRLLTADRHKRGGLTLAATIFLCFYGAFALAYVGSLVLIPIRQNQYIISAWAIVVWGTVAIIIGRGWLTAWATRYLNLLAAILLLFPLCTIVRHWVFADREFRVVAGNLEAATFAPESAEWRHSTEWSDQYIGTAQNHFDPADAPDIYLIVLDKYSASRSLAKNYGFDNSTFEEELRSLGFFVAQSARTNYIHTFLSLASLLNWVHLHDIAEQVGQGSSDRTLPYQMIEDNRTWRFLKERGYRFVFFRTPYSGTMSNSHADLQIPEVRQTTGIDLSYAWFSGTVVAPVSQWLSATLNREARGFPYPPEHPKQIERKFQQLANVSQAGQPSFVFAHILVPHEPFIFEADCRHRKPLWPMGGSRMIEMQEWGELYTAQVSCVNQLVIRLVRELRGRQERRSIIILQSDHGHGRIDYNPLGARETPLSHLSDEQREERIGVFAAYYLLGKEPPVLYDSITPVNVFPVIFNEYFGAQIPLQKDESFWSMRSSPYHFVKVAPKVNK